MNALSSSDFIDAWAGRLRDAVEHPSETGFDGRRTLPAYLRESAAEQAERVFLVLDGKPVPDRDLGWAEKFVHDSSMAFLMAWGEAMAAFGADREPWARRAAEDAVQAYNARLNELAPGLHAGGRA